MRVGSFLGILTSLVLSGCYSEQTLFNLSMAENIRKTSDERIFVTAGDGLYEVTRNENQEWVPVLIYESEDECSYFAGMAELNGWLFFVCAVQEGFNFNGASFQNSGMLMALSLSAGNVESVLALSGYQFANGMDAVVEKNILLLADENFLAQGGVTKLVINFDSDVPAVEEEVYHWINDEHEVYAANGVRVIGNDVYLTDIGYLKRVPIDDDWIEPGPAQEIYKRYSVFDDIDVYCDGLLVTDFVQGKLTYVSLDGAYVKNVLSGLTSPSAVLANASPLIEGGILFTETAGLIPNGGNRLALGVPQFGQAWDCSKR